MEPLKRHKSERHDVRETSPFLVLLGHCYFPRLTTAELGVVTILLNSNPNILRHTRSLWKPMRVIKLHLCLFCANTLCHKFCNTICVTVVFFSAPDVCCSHFLLFVNYHWTSKTRQEKYVLVQDFGVARKSLFRHVKSSNNQTLC